MKKLLCILMILAMGLTIQAAEKVDAGLGFGYQGIYFGNLINAASLRFAPGPVGGQILFGTWNGDLDTNGGPEADMRLWTLQGKLLFTLIEKDYTDFYVGAKIGYSWADISVSGTSNEPDISDWTYGLLVGAEWFFAEIPEIGFNFEVAYDFNDLEYDSPAGGPDADIGLDGVNVNLGLHYYF